MHRCAGIGGSVRLQLIFIRLVPLAREDSPVVAIAVRVYAVDERSRKVACSGVSKSATVATPQRDLIVQPVFGLSLKITVFDRQRLIDLRPSGSG